jgi:NAD(P)H-hydrate epimerase
MNETHDLPPLPNRARDAHKGMLGRVCVIGGCQTMAGAPAIVAQAALRTGCGLVQVACDEAIQQTVMTITPCATTCSPAGWEAFKPDVIAVGPGWGAGRAALLERVLNDHGGSVVIDADGLNAMATLPQWWKACGENIVLTPHAGEMKRLVEQSPIEHTSDRMALARGVAHLCRATIVLKGAATIVATPEQIYVNTTGNPGMATAGSGDVLTGIIASLAGQGLNSFESASLGVYLHGASGDRAAAMTGQAGMIATDLIDALPAAIEDYRAL